MKTARCVRIVFASLALSAIGFTLGASPFAGAALDKRSANTYIRERLANDAAVEGILALTRPLLDEQESGNREVRVLVHALRVTEGTEEPSWVTGQRLVEAAGATPVTLDFRVGGARCRGVVKPRDELTWGEVKSHHDFGFTLER
jgi:hypothetical protein